MAAAGALLDIAGFVLMILHAIADRPTCGCC